MTRVISRRRLLTVSAGALAAAPLVMPPNRCRAADEKSLENPICVFTKPFNSLSFDQLADRMAELGVQGIEAPIRKGGHIEPEAVPERLHELVEALKSRGLEITVLTSDINDPSDPISEKVLRVAAGLGVKRYRMKYLRYELNRPVAKQIQNWRPQMKELAALNNELGITAIYQNHAGRNQVGAALWDLPILLKGIPPTEIGVAYDIRHATVEGGMSWPITFNRIQPHLNTVYVKDFQWDGRKPKNVPLGEGNVDPKFFSMLKNTGFDGPISLHEEYLDHRKPDLVPEHIQAIKKDLSVLRSWLG